MDVESVLDARGLMCPEPLVQTKLRLDSMPSGEVLVVWTTDPLAPLDLQAFCLRTGHGWLGSERLDAGDRSRLRRR
jgi:tRNA 2-thiouridine synthesizing protein A